MRIFSIFSHKLYSIRLDKYFFYHLKYVYVCLRYVSNIYMSHELRINEYYIFISFTCSHYLMRKIQYFMFIEHV